MAPIPIVTPIIFETKLIYHSLCDKELEWDEPMPSEDLSRWEKWLETLLFLHMVSVPRWLGLKRARKLHKCASFITSWMRQI